MPATTRQPNADQGTPQWTPKGAGTNFSEVDESVAGQDGTTTENTVIAKNLFDNLELQDMPGDFDVAVDYKIRCVIRQAGRVDDTVEIETRITDAAVDIDAFLDTHDITSVTSYTTFEGAVRANTDNKAAWDGYEVEYVSRLTQTGMPDAVTWSITAIEVLLNYDVPAAGLPPGLGPAVQQQQPHHADAALMRY